MAGVDLAEMFGELKHDLEALPKTAGDDELQASASNPEIHALAGNDTIFGGKNPHLQSFLVGGMATPVDPDRQASINMGSVARIKELTARARELWECLAGAAAGFTPAMSVAVVPRSYLCPPGWAGIVVLGSAALVTAPDRDTAVVVLTHEDLVGFMGSMTMGFRVHDPKLYEGLDIGDEVTVRLAVTQRR